MRKELARRAHERKNTIGKQVRLYRRDPVPCNALYPLKSPQQLYERLARSSPKIPRVHAR